MERTRRASSNRQARISDPRNIFRSNVHEKPHKTIATTLIQKRQDGELIHSHNHKHNLLVFPRNCEESKMRVWNFIVSISMGFDFLWFFQFTIVPTQYEGKTSRPRLNYSKYPIYNSTWKYFDWIYFLKSFQSHSDIDMCNWISRWIIKWSCRSFIQRMDNSTGHHIMHRIVAQDN